MHLRDGRFRPLVDVEEGNVWLLNSPPCGGQGVVIWIETQVLPHRGSTPGTFPTAPYYKLAKNPDEGTPTVIDTIDR